MYDVNQHIKKLKLYNLLMSIALNGDYSYMALQQVRRGKPSAPTTIVDEITKEQQVLQENWRLLDLGSMFFVITAKFNILNSYKDATDGYRWKCKGCKERRSVRQDSFFSQSRLSLQTLLYYIYGWSRNMPQKDIQHEAGMNDASHTLADLANFCRDVCEVDLETNPAVIGDFNTDGTAVVVEIDESKFFHRKYCGQMATRLLGVWWS
nr:uncharacterized protein LOC124816034 [Hydra vulgaris]